MNHTKNYNLPQWELNDLIRMEDFNGAMANLENGLTEAKQRDDSLSNRIDATRALATQVPYVTGSYTGNGENQVIDVGFRPSFVIVSGEGEAPLVGTTAAATYGFNLFSGGNLLPNKITFTDTGIILKKEASKDNLYPNLTLKGHVYDYILFR